MSEDSKPLLSKTARSESVIVWEPDKKLEICTKDIIDSTNRIHLSLNFHIRRSNTILTGDTVRNIWPLPAMRFFRMAIYVAHHPVSESYTLACVLNLSKFDRQRRRGEVEELYMVTTPGANFDGPNKEWLFKAVPVDDPPRWFTNITKIRVSIGRLDPPIES